jgi:hypothetical protein
MIDRDWEYAGGYHAGGSVAQRRFGTTLRRSRFEEATRLWKKVITDRLEAVTVS